MAKRLKTEAKKLADNPPDFASAEPDGENLFQWNAMVIGPQDTPYQNGLFNVSLTFPTDYPFKPPDVRFVTKIYHPSVKTDTGEICADIIKGGWKPTQDVLFVLGVLKQMLLDPTPDGAVEPEIAQQVTNDYENFKRKAEEFTREYAS